MLSHGRVVLPLMGVRPCLWLLRHGCLALTTSLLLKVWRRLRRQLWRRLLPCCKAAGRRGPLPRLAQEVSRLVCRGLPEHVGGGDMARLVKLQPRDAAEGSNLAQGECEGIVLETKCMHWGRPQGRTAGHREVLTCVTMGSYRYLLTDNAVSRSRS